MGHHSGYAGPAMQCPFCHESETRVVDSRPAEANTAIRRRRECSACGRRFTTYERVVPMVMVRKRSGRLEAFAAEKVRRGIEAALADRPVPGGWVDDLVAEVEEDALAASGAITSEAIGRRVLAALRELDEVAYLRFASVYEEFQGVEDFQRAVQEMDVTVAREPDRR